MVHDTRRGATAAAPQRILLADADAFFVEVARRADPEGAGRAPLLLVGGSPTGRGVVTSASYETRRYGVRSGMPMAQALRLCPQAVRVPVPMAACRRTSRLIRAVLERFTPVVEPASIDEFYLDLTGTEQLYRGETLEQTARRIRRAVAADAGVPVSVGGGTTRLVAKLAARRAKPHADRMAAGVVVVSPGAEAAFLAEHDLAQLPGIGPRLQERLARYGLRSVRDALRHDERALTAWLGERTARWLHRRIRGIDPTPVHGRLAAKSLSHEQTFPTDLAADAALERQLLKLAGRVAADLRARGLAGRTITVKLRDADFTTRQASRTLPEPVAADRPIFATARTLLRRLRHTRRVPARLLGVALSHLVRPGAETAQLPLFGAEGTAVVETERDRRLAKAMDAISEKYGRGRILRGEEYG